MHPREVGSPVDSGGDDRDLDKESRRALNDLVSTAYEELLRLAASVKHSGPTVTLSPATLVNEAWLKLAHSTHLAPQSKLHFKRIAARAMRQILVEAARRRGAYKRGGGAVVFVTYDDSVDGLVSCDRDVLALHAALDELATVNPRQATLVEVRFFGGLDTDETAELLGVSKKTVDRDWRTAKAWLASQILQTR